MAKNKAQKKRGQQGKESENSPNWLKLHKFTFLSLRQTNATGKKHIRKMELGSESSTPKTGNRETNSTLWLTFVYGNHTEFIISIASIERRLRELWPLRLAIHSISQFKLVELHKIGTWSYMGCSNNLWVVLLDPVAWLIFANAKKQRGGIKKLIKFTFIPEKALENARLMRPFERRWQWRWWWCWWPWWWWWWWWGERQLSLGDLNIDKHKTCPKRRDASTHPSQSQLKCHRISIQFARHGIR